MNKKEIEEKDNQELFEAKENTIKYWKKMMMIDIRYHQRTLPLSNERKKFE